MADWADAISTVNLPPVLRITIGFIERNFLPLLVGVILCFGLWCWGRRRG